MGERKYVLTVEGRPHSEYKHRQSAIDAAMGLQVRIGAPTNMAITEEDDYSWDEPDWDSRLLNGGGE